MDERDVTWPGEVRIALGLLADILAALRRIEKLLQEHDGWEEEAETES